MYRITLVCVGKLRENFLRAAVREYSKRLVPYALVDIKEVSDESVAESASAREVEQAKRREAERIMAKLPASSFVIACDLNGEEMTSEQFANRIEELAVRGRSHLCFIIGGSTGLHPSILQRSDWQLSFGRMTYPHQLMRVILLEQIYRAMKIIRNEPYHK